MNPLFYIAKRYAFTKSKTKAIHLITLISSVGIVVSSMAMLVVLSVFSGLEKYSLSFVNAMDADLTVLPSEGKFLELSTAQYQKIQTLPEVRHVARVVEERVVFLFNEKQLVATLKAVDSNYLQMAQLQPHIYAGQWLAPHSRQVVLGNALAEELSVGLYSNAAVLEVLAMKPGEGMISTPEEAYNQFMLQPSGIYSFNNFEVDSKYVYGDLLLGQQLLDLDSEQVSQIELQLTPNANEAQLHQKIQSLFKPPLVFKNRIELNDSLYKMLQTERLAIFLIFSLVIMVTLFCLAGALIMIILEKKAHFKTLSDLGFTLTQLRKIVLYQGLLLSVGGALIGLVLGGAVAYLQQEFHWIMISEGVPYPVELRIQNFVLVFATLCVLGFLASFLASSRLRIQS